MVEGDGQDKRHPPTTRRLREAAARGDVRRSTDFAKAVAVVGATLVAFGASAGMGAHLAGYAAAWLSEAGTAPSALAMAWAGALFLQLAPLLMMFAAIAAAASIGFGGWVFSLALLKPDLSKLLPAHGLGQLFSRTGLSETLKALLKFVLIGGVGAAVITHNGPEFSALAGLPRADAWPLIRLCLGPISAICFALVLLAFADLALQSWLHRHRLRMSDAELREEMKDAAGNPQVRQRQRMIARKLARARQMRRIPEASVIVTNPAHFAVAIRYQRGIDRAPLLLAKGAGLLAAEIISRGRGLGIPVVEAPPLARAVYRHVEPGESVPVALYRACAEVLAYVWKMQRWRAQGGARPAPPKAREGEIEVRAWPQA